MVVGKVAEVTKDRGKEETGLGWALKEVRLRFIWLFQNTATTKDIGKLVITLGEISFAACIFCNPN